MIRLMRKEYFIIITLFLLSLSYKLYYFYNHQDLTTFTSMVGIPFSDAVNWDLSAESFSLGKGLTGYYASLRPFYTIFLGSIYAITGHSLFVAKFTNIILSTLSVILVYLIGKIAYNRLVGFIVSICFLSSIPVLNDSLSLMTETLGLFLFMASLYYLLSGMKMKSYKLILLAGILSGLSNLTRPLTLFATPFYLVALSYSYSQNLKHYKKAILAVAMYLGGIILVISPWLARQKIVHNIISISSNEAVVWYAASSPLYKVWSYEVYQEPALKKLSTLKEQNEYFTKSAIENIIKYPSFYRSHVIESFTTYLKYYKFSYSSYYLLFFTLIFTLFKINRKLTFSHVIKVILVSLLIATSFYMLPQEYDWIISLFGLATSITGIYATITGIGLLLIGFGSSLFAHAGVIDRLFVMVNWSFDLLYFYSLYVLLVIGNQLVSTQKFGNVFALIRKDIWKTIPPTRAENNYLAFTKNIVAVILGILFAISISIILSRSILQSRNVSSVNKTQTLSIDQEVALLKQIRAISPNLIREDEINNLSKYLIKQVSYEHDAENHGKIVIEPIHIDRYVYHYPNNIAHWLRLFEKRNYDRTIFSSEIGTSNGFKFYIMPGYLPLNNIGKEFIIIGKLNVDDSEVFQSRKFVELIALINNDSESTQKIIVFDNDEHLKILQSLTAP